VVPRASWVSRARALTPARAGLCGERVDQSQALHSRGEQPRATAGDLFACGQCAPDGSAGRGRPVDGAVSLTLRFGGGDTRATRMGAGSGRGSSVLSCRSGRGSRVSCTTSRSFSTTIVRRCEVVVVVISAFFLGGCPLLSLLSLLCSGLSFLRPRPRPARRAAACGKRTPTPQGR
jgi:hypothetical protein